MTRKRKYKSSAHKELNLEHEAFLKSITGKTRPRLKGIQEEPKPLSATTPLYPSLEEKPAPDSTCVVPHEGFKSSEYTIMIGYNKGNYTLVPRSELHTAGKKI